MLIRQYMREKELDYETVHRKGCLKMHTALEYHASKIYTKELFRKFQDQLIEATKYFFEKDQFAWEEAKQNGDPNAYYTCYRPLSDPQTRINYFVSFNKFVLTGMCLCRIFQHLGMPCRYILAVLIRKCIAEIYETFLLRRWTMHANRVDGVLPYDVSIGGSHEMTETDRFNNMVMLTMSFCHNSITSKECYDYVVDVMNREISNLDNMRVDGVNEEPNIDHITCENLNEPILDPIVSQTKWRKK